MQVKSIFCLTKGFSPDYIKLLLKYLHSRVFWILMFVKKVTHFFHFGKRKYNIIHCQLRNSASNLMAGPMFIRYTNAWTLYWSCWRCSPLFFTCSKYTNFRDVFCQTIQNIFDCDHIFDLDLLLYGSPDHGLNINTQIFEAVHAYIAATTRFI